MESPNSPKTNPSRSNEYSSRDLKSEESPSKDQRKDNMFLPQVETP